MLPGDYDDRDPDGLEHRRLRAALRDDDRATNADSKNLRDQMTLVIKTKDTNTAGCANFNGTQLYSGTLAAGAIGDPTTGAQAGDRSLAGPGSEVLCFRATLPSTTTSLFQGAATTATFTFSAEQTANNP